MSGLTHFDGAGAAHMVDVSGKPETDRVAVAEGWVRMSPATLDIVRSGTAAKGDVLGVARLAGIMAAKRTADLIPLCHPLPLSRVALDLVADPDLPGLRDHRDGGDGRPHRCGDGGADRRLRRLPDGLRHGQGGAEGHGDRRGAAPVQDRRQVRRLEGAGS